MSAPAQLPPFSAGRIVVIGGAVGVLGAAGVALGFALDPHRALLSYLAAFAYVVSVALGALIFLMIAHAMNAGWPVAVRRLLEAASAALPACGVLALPLLLGLRFLYPWMRPDQITDAHAHALLLKKLGFLNAPFFIGRTVFYFVFLSTVAGLLRRWSLQQDAGSSLPLKARQRALSAGALPATGIVLTLAAVDWLMSLSPNWVSSIFGLYYFAGGFLGALGLVTWLASRAQARGALPLGESHFYALGRLLLAFTIFWAYIVFFQFMLIWIANRPVEVSFYLARVAGPWRDVSIVIALLHFVVPFLALLPYAPKRSGAAMGVAGMYLLILHYFDVHWIVLPEARGATPYHWLDAAALAAVVGFAVAFAAWRQNGHALAPQRDPDYERAVRYYSI